VSTVYDARALSELVMIAYHCEYPLTEMCQYDGTLYKKHGNILTWEILTVWQKYIIQQNLRHI
jgi:hypothetical protein